MVLQGRRGDAVFGANDGAELAGERQLALGHRRPCTGCASAQVLSRAYVSSPSILLHTSMNHNLDIVAHINSSIVTVAVIEDNDVGTY